MFKLIFSDIDSTLIDNIHPICSKNLEAISYLKKKKVIFTLCTGKSYAISKDFCKQLGADFGIFGNGSHIVNLSTGEEIFKNALPLSTLQACLEILKECNLHIHAYTEGSIITEKLAYLDLRNWVLFPGKINVHKVSNIYDTLITQNEGILQLVVSSGDDLSKLKSKLQQVNGINIMHIRKTGKYRDNIINKDYEYLDISDSNVSKGNAVKALSRYLGIPKSETLAIGDNINDISMFKEVGLGIAVQNSYDETKQVATYITTNTAKDGAFAEAVYKFM